MYNIAFHKEITSVEEKLICNLTKRQIVWMALGLAIDIPLVIFVRPILGETVEWLAMVVGGLCGAVGFFKKDGMNFEEYAKAYIAFNFKTSSKRYYKSEDLEERLLEEAYQEKIKDYNNLLKKRGKKK